MPEIVFPTSTSFSENKTENSGRLINCFAEPLAKGSRPAYRIRRDYGLKYEFAIDVAEGSKPRGGIYVAPVLYVVHGSKAYSITLNATTYSVTELAGTVGGEGAVFMARNMRAPNQNIVIVHSSGVSVIDVNTGVSDLNDPDLPSPNSVCFMDGFFIFTTQDGRAFSSGLNDISVNANDFVTAEFSPDGLKRAIAYERDLVLMGDDSIEFYSNTGNATGFSFTRGHAASFGLIGTKAVAGFEAGFTGFPMWVGNDNQIYSYGYKPSPIKANGLEYLIDKVEDKTSLEASVYIEAGTPFWILSCDKWTWAFNQKTGQWHEKKSYRRDNWRAQYSVNAFNKWLVMDRESGIIFSVDHTKNNEYGQPLIFEARSEQDHNYPARRVVSKAYFDFVTGVGIDQGASGTQKIPQAMISWSDDGGVRFSNQLLRPLGTQGDTDRTVSVHRCGMSGAQGRQWKLKVSDPVPVSLLGGAFDGDVRAAHG